MRIIKAVVLTVVVVAMVLVLPILNGLTGNVNRKTGKCAEFNLGRLHVKACIGETNYAGF